MSEQSFGSAGSADIHLLPDDAGGVMRKIGQAGARAEAAVAAQMAEIMNLELQATGYPGPIAERFLENYNKLAPDTKQIASLVGALLASMANLGTSLINTHNDTESQVTQNIASTAQVSSSGNS